MKKWRLRLALGLITTAALMGGVTFLWWNVSDWPGEQCDTIRKADVIVILGGNTAERGAIGLKLYQDGIAPRLIVSGDSGEIMQYLKDGGMEESALLHEGKSRSTWENGTFVKPILEDLRVTNVVLVTSWYHAGRARAVFERLMPEIRFQIACGSPPENPNPDDRRLLKRERLAFLLYWWKYGISLFR